MLYADLKVSDVPKPSFSGNDEASATVTSDAT
jgi:hypothetical protein